MPALTFNKKSKTNVATGNLSVGGKDLYAYTLLYTPRTPTPGMLFAWGYNRHGELGIGTAANSGPDYAGSSPVQVGALATWTYVACGWNQSFGRTNDGKLFAWGLNHAHNLTYGVLGLGDIINRSSPTQLGSLTTWSHVTSGSNSSSGGIVNGKAYFWGDITQGGPTIYASIPVQIGTRTDWADFRVQAHFRHGIIGGKLYAWGENDWGQLGLGYYTPNQGPGVGPTSPVQVGSSTRWFELVRTGNLTGMALRRNRTLWAWGDNNRGQAGVVGHNTITSLSNYVVINPYQVNSNTWSDQIAQGYDHTVAIDTTGKLWVWGGNAYGQLGLGYTSYGVISPIQLGAATWISVAAGQKFTLAVKSDGTLWAWGKNIYGRLGLGDITPRSSPAQIGALTTWVSCFAQEYTGFAIRT